MSDQLTTLQAISSLVETWHDRSRMTYETTRERMGDYLGIVEYDRDTFYNKFRRDKNRNPSYQTDEVLALIYAYVDGLPVDKRCRPAEAIRMVSLAQLPLDAFSEPRAWFPQVDYDAALEQYFEKQNLRVTSPGQHDATYLKPSYTPLFIGRDDILHRLYTRLGVWRRSDRQPVTIIRGSIGVGKSTLVNHLLHEDMVCEEFRDGILWAHLGQHTSSGEAMRHWCRQLGMSPLPRDASLCKIIHHLRRGLQNRDMLLVVDDVWQEADGLAFRKLATKHTTLLMTTRVTEIAHRMATIPGDVLTMPSLPPEDAMQLLTLVAPKATQQYRPAMQHLAQMVDGLPLALRVAGTLVEHELEWDDDIETAIDNCLTNGQLFTQKAPEDYFEETHACTPTVADVFQRSLDALSTEVQQTLITLVHAVAPQTTVSLHDLPPLPVADQRTVIKTLVQRGLLEPTGGGTFQIQPVLSHYLLQMPSPASVPH